MTSKRKSIFIAIGVVVLALTIILSLNQFYVAYLWFNEMSYLNIFFKELVTRLQIGIPVFAVITLFLYFYLKWLDGISAKNLGLEKPKRNKKENISCSR